MAEVKIIDIDGVQWEMKDQTARDKITEQDTKIENLTTKINTVEKKCERFYYNADTDKDILQNRIDAMIHCYNNSKNGIATIRYSNGYYYNVIMPAISLERGLTFVEITYSGNINIYEIKSNTEYKLIRAI